MEIQPQNQNQNATTLQNFMTEIGNKIKKHNNFNVLTYDQENIGKIQIKNINLPTAKKLITYLNQKGYAKKLIESDNYFYKYEIYLRFD
jgi:hypothetical protein